MAKNTPSPDVDGVTKGKTPRNALILVGVVVAVIVAAMGFYYQTKDGDEAAAAAEAKRQAKLAQSVEKPATNEDVDKIIADQEQAARDAEKRQRLEAASSPVSTPRPGLSADAFEQDPHVQALAESADDDALYTAPIFKAGDKVNAHGTADTVAAAATLNPVSLMLAQQAAAKQANNQAADAAALAQTKEGATTASTLGKADDLKFLKDTALQSKTNDGFKSSTFVGQERGCTLAPPHHIDVLAMEGANSDRPGTIALMVNEDVYDSVHGTCLMIPKGTTVTAPYSSDIAPGQESLLVAATEMRLPNGKEVPLDGAPGADPNGYNGFSAHVNNHFFEIYGTSFLTAILVHKYEDNETTTTTSGAYGVTQVGSTAGQVAAQTSQSVLQRYQNIQPTLTIKAGEHFMLKLTHNLVLEPYHYE